MEINIAFGGGGATDSLVEQLADKFLELQIWTSMTCQGLPLYFSGNIIRRHQESECTIGT
jgi:hypothetical protein